MKIRIAREQLKEHPRQFIKRCGYGEIFDRLTKKTSYVRRLGEFHYPRFHCYLIEEEDHLVVDLHLDEKKASYEGETRHSGQYDGPLVEQEIHRIASFVSSSQDGAKKLSLRDKMAGKR